MNGSLFVSHHHEKVRSVDANQAGPINPKALRKLEMISKESVRNFVFVSHILSLSRRKIYGKEEEHDSAGITG